MSMPQMNGPNVEMNNNINQQQWPGMVPSQPMPMGGDQNLFMQMMMANMNPQF